MTDTYWRWPDYAGPVLIAQRVAWSFRDRMFTGQACELWDDEGVAIVDADDGNRWHFDLETGEIVRRFPIPLPVTGPPDRFVVLHG